MSRDPTRTTPIGLVRYAKDFFDTALAADNVIGRRPGFEVVAPVPIMYLVGHSIELALKAYLLHAGITLDDLASRKYGHDLENCFEAANTLSLSSIVSFEAGEIEAMKVLNELYSTKQLNYIASGPKTYPVFGPLETFCRKLLNSVGPHVGYNR